MAIARLSGVEGQPKCFVGTTPREAKIIWWGWNTAASVASANPGSSSYCNDCQPWYQAEMIRLGLCEHPGTTFRQESDGSIYDNGMDGLVGVRPTHGKLPANRKRPIVEHPDGIVVHRVKKDTPEERQRRDRAGERWEAADGIADVSIHLPPGIGALYIFQAS